MSKYGRPTQIGYRNFQAFQNWSSSDRTRILFEEEKKKITADEIAPILLASNFESFVSHSLGIIWIRKTSNVEQNLLAFCVSTEKTIRKHFTFN